jgi:hypothetical protein
MKHNLKTLREQFNKLQAANDKFGHEKAKHVATILQHCDVCEGVLKLWIENEKERKVLAEQLEGFEKELKEMQKKFRKEIYGDENFDGTTAIPIEEILGAKHEKEEGGKAK